jgi:hypothetical protein
MWEINREKRVRQGERKNRTNNRTWENGNREGGEEREKNRVILIWSNGNIECGNELNLFKERLDIWLNNVIFSCSLFMINVGLGLPINLHPVLDTKSYSKA